MSCSTDVWLLCTSFTDLQINYHIVLRFQSVWPEMHLTTKCYSIRLTSDQDIIQILAAYSEQVQTGSIRQGLS